MSKLLNKNGISKSVVTNNFYSSIERKQYHGYKIVPSGTKKRGNKICKTFEVLSKYIPSIKYTNWENLFEISFGSSLRRFATKHELKNPKYDINKLPFYMLTSLIRDFGVPKQTSEAIFSELRKR